MNTFKNKFAAVLVALALVAGTFGVAPTAQAESNSGSSSAVSTSNEVLIKLLQELIKVLQAQLAALSSGVDDSQEDEDEDVEDEDKDDDAGLSELEATIYLNETLIKVELNDEKDLLQTSADSRSEIIAVILAEYSQLTEEEVDAALEIEEEDRDSESSDLDWADEDDDEDDEDEDEDDEDEDDD